MEETSHKTESIANIAQALAQAQAEFGVLETTKSTQYPARGGMVSFKWADLGAIRRHIMPKLAKYGLAVLQDTIYSDGLVLVTTKLVHKSGEMLVSSPLSLPCTTKDPKEFGGFVTYACRYSLTSFLSIPIEEADLDDETELGKVKQEQKPDYSKMVYKGSDAQKRYLNILCEKKKVPADLRGKMHTDFIARAVLSNETDLNKAIDEFLGEA